MGKNILAIILIFFGVCAAWLVLGGTVEKRTYSQDASLKEAVGQLWGSSQSQKAPRIYVPSYSQKQVEVEKDGKKVIESQIEVVKNYIPLEGSNINVDLKVDYRKKGLLWYSTYRTKFDGDYKVANNSGEQKTIMVDFEFPNSSSVYDNFRFVVGNKQMEDIKTVNGMVSTQLQLEPGQAENIKVSYETQGMDEWWYDFGENVNQVKNFTLLMNTDFKTIDFPQNSISPTEKIGTADGWQLKWHYSNLLTGVKVGMSMPKKLNPGPWVASVSYFAPVSLFLFLFMVIIFSVMKGIKIHPVNYFFICAAYFSFHLLLAYLADHISIHLAFIICSIVSIFLVVSYMRIVVGNKFALMEVGISQFVFLVVFSYTFFFKGYTGLTVTILSILTLFIAMQLTARVKWGEVFAVKKPDKDFDQIV